MAVDTNSDTHFPTKGNGSISFSPKPNGLKMEKPNLITFTGADDKTSIAGMIALAKIYDVEFAILFSPKRTGTPRYPSMKWIKSLCEYAALNKNLMLAAHICGDYARSIIEDGTVDIDISLLNHFRTVQINTADDRPDLVDRICKWKYNSGYSGDIILQSRDEDFFPDDDRVSWLYDCSEGKGLTPEQWPSAEKSMYNVGYAGGIGLDNVLDVIAKINSKTSDYWIDMESKLRNENDEFDLTICKEICEKVYALDYIDINYALDLVRLPQIGFSRSQEFHESCGKISDETVEKIETMMGGRMSNGLKDILYLVIERVAHQTGPQIEITYIPNQK